MGAREVDRKLAAITVPKAGGSTFIRSATVVMLLHTLLRQAFRGSA
jgi:hypothetical protein